MSICYVMQGVIFPISHNSLKPENDRMRNTLTMGFMFKGLSLCLGSGGSLGRFWRGCGCRGFVVGCTWFYSSGNEFVS